MRLWITDHGQAVCDEHRSVLIPLQEVAYEEEVTEEEQAQTGARCLICATPPVPDRLCERPDCGRALHPQWPAVYCSNRCAYLDSGISAEDGLYTLAKEPLMPTIDTDNPIIDCTVMELCAFAWNEKREKWPDGYSSFASFPDWWNHLQTTETPFVSIRDAAWQAWRAARPLNEPNHGDGNHFNDWWKKTVLEAQPAPYPITQTVSAAPPADDPTKPPEGAA